MGKKNLVEARGYKTVNFDVARILHFPIIKLILVVCTYPGLTPNALHVFNQDWGILVTMGHDL